MVAHPNFQGWIRNVQGASATVATLIKGKAEQTLGTRSAWIKELETSSHAMRCALNPLMTGRDRAQVVDDLEPLADYLLSRARDGRGHEAGRPNAPALRTDAASLTELLERLATDLADLELICDAMLMKLQRLPSSAPKHNERNLIRLIAKSHMNHFGRLPPKRSWFGDHFMPYVGQCVGLDIGHRIVGEEVSDLLGDPAAL